MSVKNRIMQKELSTHSSVPRNLDSTLHLVVASVVLNQEPVQYLDTTSDDQKLQYINQT